MKRRIVLGLIIITLCVSAAVAQTDPFMPSNPITMGMGGAFTANAEGYNAFFYNPAGYARKAEFTLLSVNVYGLMDKTIYNMLVDVANEKDPTANLTASFTMPTTSPDLSAGMDGLSKYLAAVSATPTGQAAIAKAVQDIGLKVETPSSSATVSDMALQALLPALLSDPKGAEALTTKFVNAVASNSGQPASADALAAGAVLQKALNEATSALKNALPSGNANIGAQVGIGWVGKGLGLGLFANVSGGLYTPVGSSILSSVAKASTTLTLAGGLGFNIVPGFSLGFTLRPTLLGYVSFMPASMLTSLLGGTMPDQTQLLATIMSNGIYKGFRLGVDVGTLIDLGDFTLGVAVKDLLPLTFLYKKYDNIDSFTQNLSDFKDAAEMPDAYQVPGIKLNAGLQWHPDLGSFSSVLDPRIEIDLLDFMGWIRQLPGVTGSDAAKLSMMGEYDFLRQISVGAQIKLFKFISLRAGYGQGMINGGLGINLFVVDINAAVGARMNTAWTDFSEVGFSLEVALLRL